VKHTYSVHVAQIQGVVLAKETAELIPNGARPVKGPDVRSFIKVLE